MTGWLIFGAYLIPVIPVWRRVAYSLANECGPPDSGDVAFGIGLGLVLAFAFWWAIVIVYVFNRVTARVGVAFLKPPPNVAARLKAKAQQEMIDNQARRIRQLEQEVLSDADLR